MAGKERDLVPKVQIKAVEKIYEEEFVKWIIDN